MDDIFALENNENVKKSSKFKARSHILLNKIRFWLNTTGRLYLPHKRFRDKLKIYQY